MMLHLSERGSDEFARLEGGIAAQQAFEAEVTEEFLRSVLCLAHAVGEEVEHRLLVQLHLLTFVGETLKHAQRQVGDNRDGGHTAISTNRQGGIVPGIAIAQAARREVEHTEEGGAEHAQFVAVGQGVVERGDNLLGLVVVQCR